LNDRTPGNIACAMPSSQQSRRLSPSDNVKRPQVIVAYSQRLHPDAEFRNAYSALAEEYGANIVFIDEPITSEFLQSQLLARLKQSDAVIVDAPGAEPILALILGCAVAVGKPWYVAEARGMATLQSLPEGFGSEQRIEYISYSDLQHQLANTLGQRFMSREFEPAADDSVVRAPEEARKRAPKKGKRVASAMPRKPTSKSVAKASSSTRRGNVRTNARDSQLNEKEQKVLALLRKRRVELPIAEIGAACFRDQEAPRANSWTRNSLRKLVAERLVRQTGRGLYSSVK
jgi:hypothetical protein